MTEVVVAASILGLILLGSISLMNTAFNGRTLMKELEAAEGIFENIRMVASNTRLCGKKNVMDPNDGSLRSPMSRAHLQVGGGGSVSSPDFDRIEVGGGTIVQQGSVYANRVKISKLQLQGDMAGALLPEKGPANELRYLFPIFIHVEVSSVNPASSSIILTRDIPTQAVTQDNGSGSYEIIGCHVQDFIFSQRIASVSPTGTIDISSGVGLADMNVPKLPSEEDVSATFYNDSNATNFVAGCRTSFGWQLTGCSRTGLGVTNSSVKLRRLAPTAGMPEYHLGCVSKREPGAQLRVSCTRVNP